MDMTKYARWYASQGLAVFPLATIEDGQCSCGKVGCGSPGKHPLGDLAPHGCKDATGELSSIEQWWSVYPDANIGIATGAISGILVIDIDEDHGGWQTLENLAAYHGELPITWTASTGGGGGHFYFRLPLREIRNSAGTIGAGIDVRGEGGYVVAPPSRHLSGYAYVWVDEWHPKRTPLANCPDWLIERMAGRSNNTQTKTLPERITAGQRNVWMASAAGMMRRHGFNSDAINAALQVENTQRCDPPLGTREIERIAISIERYQPYAEATVSYGQSRRSA